MLATILFYLLLAFLGLALVGFALLPVMAFTGMRAFLGGRNSGATS